MADKADGNDNGPGVIIATATASTNCLSFSQWCSVATPPYRNGTIAGPDPNTNAPALAKNTPNCDRSGQSSVLIQPLAAGSGAAGQRIRVREGGFKEPGIVPVKIDVTDKASIAAAAKIAADTTLLINNAGIAALIEGPLAGDAEDQSKQMFETNYYGVVRVSQAFEAVLTDKPQAAIINVLSDIVWLPRPILTPYAASKAAAWSFTNQLRFHLKGRNIHVLGLHVGFVDTDLTKGIDVPKSSPDDVVRQTYDALAAGKNEVMADKGTAVLKSTLAAEVPGYIEPPEGV